MLSAQSNSAGSKEAFAELCRLYWYPLYGFIRHRGYSPEDAQDLTQEFASHPARVVKSRGSVEREVSILLAGIAAELFVE